MDMLSILRAFRDDDEIDGEGAEEAGGVGGDA